MSKEKRISMGIGDAILRLMHVERMYADGVDPGEDLVAERNLIVQALNQQYALDLGMDCDEDGIPDSIDKDFKKPGDVNFLQVAAKTSCCRIKYDDEAESPVDAEEEKPTQTNKSSSRKSRKSSSRTSKTSSRVPKTSSKKSPSKKGFVSSLFGTKEEG